MDIFEYLDYIKPIMKRAYEKDDKEEFIRLAQVLRETLLDVIRGIRQQA